MFITDENGNGVEISGQTIISNVINLMAQAYENTGKTNATGLNRDSIKVYVDGVELKEDYISSPTTNRADVEFPLYVPEGYIFVLKINLKKHFRKRVLKNTLIFCF